MNLPRALRLGQSIVLLVILTSCTTTEQEAYHHRNSYTRDNYDYEGFNSSYATYEAPARVTHLQNGNYIVNIGNHVATFHDDGSLISSAGCSPSELYHAEQALRAYRAGHRGEFHHPNHTYDTYPSVAYQQYAAQPKVRPRGDGRIEVLLPRGGIVLYDNRGHLLQRGGAVSNSELADANRAVEKYIRANYVPSNAPPEVRERGDGRIEVLLPRGGVVLYDSQGRLIQKGATVSSAELSAANRAVQTHVRQNYKSSGTGTPPQVRQRGDGKFEVLLPRGGVVLYDNRGHLLQKGATVSKSELNEANRAAQSYVRENFGPHSGQH